MLASDIAIKQHRVVTRTPVALMLKLDVLGTVCEETNCTSSQVAQDTKTLTIQLVFLTTLNV